MPEKLAFQDVVLKFLDFWKDQGCLVWHPHNVQVGAGTMNPATVLRVLGPEPWKVVYLEPSIRPDDGRFGENPNRMQQHYQLQVILKPDPGNPQELYLQSLEAVGFDLSKHDIRFVEDNWEQPALGAWGLGWEVWMDGQEITQFTYFQQAGGINLDPVSVELTYGLDRIVLALQDVDSVWEIDYGAEANYGDLLLQSEIESCRYYFNVADVDTLRNVYDAYEKEAERCLSANLIAPAHDFNLKCSFLFNVMDTRGAIGVTERANYFRRMRRIARQVAQQYEEQRQRLEYPFLENKNWQDVMAASPEEALEEAAVSGPQDFVLEIGSEELPVSDLDSAISQLKKMVPQLLKDLRLEYSSFEVEGTPRRLMVIVHKLADRQRDLDIEVKGPPADRAFDSQGQPTKAALGFASSKGVRPADLRILNEGERRYVAALVREKGRSSVDVLADVLPDLIAGIKFEKDMRWNQSNIQYSRPLRWLVALFGSAVIPFSYADVNSGRVSWGLRSKEPSFFEIDNAANYASIMAENDIVIQTRERKAVVRTAAGNLADEVGGVIREDPALMAEVANLVEQPTLLRGEFEKRFLTLPTEVLVAVMKKHQRYFPVYAADGRELLPYFITARNGGNEHLDIIRNGNEHVIRARFSDAEFFYKSDSQYKLEEFLPKLAKLTFQTDLGSMLDKVHRLEKLTPAVADILELIPEEVSIATRAAALSKADLATSMVVEMTSLQGIIGGQYALLSGEQEAVAQAIGEQYEAVSESRPGLALALADRIDSLIGLFAVGLAPTSSNDPFALRRAAIRIIENLTANEADFDLRKAFTIAASYVPVELDDGVIDQVLEFSNSRLETYLQELGFRTSVVRAVIAEQGHNPFAAKRSAEALDEIVREDYWGNLLDAYARCVRITRDQPVYDLHPTDFSLAAEKDLMSAYEEAVTNLDGTVPSFVSVLEKLEPTITNFFNGVLVMDEDLAVKQNRLALLQRIAGLADGIADLSQLEGF